MYGFQRRIGELKSLVLPESFEQGKKQKKAVIF
jgi:hypothetical protein